MSIANICLLTVSLVLQLSLLILMFTRRTASEVRFFAVLLCFYAFRSVLLVVLFPWVSLGSYVQTYTALSAADVLLQIALGVEFSLIIVRLGERPYLPRAFATPGIFLISALLASGIVAMLPAHSRAPADRAGIFTGLLFLGLLAWSLSVRLLRWQRSALTGLAGIGAAGIVTQVGRNLAAIHQNAHAYRLWSYSNAVVYVITLVFWIAHCKPARSREPRVVAAGGIGSSEGRALRPQLPL